MMAKYYFLGVDYSLSVNWHTNPDQSYALKLYDSPNLKLISLFAEKKKEGRNKMKDLNSMIYQQESNLQQIETKNEQLQTRLGQVPNQIQEHKEGKLTILRSRILIC